MWVGSYDGQLAQENRGAPGPGQVEGRDVRGWVGGKLCCGFGVSSAGPCRSPGARGTRLCEHPCQPLLPEAASLPGAGAPGDQCGGPRCVQVDWGGSSSQPELCPAGWSPSPQTLSRPLLGGAGSVGSLRLAHLGLLSGAGVSHYAQIDLTATAAAHKAGAQHAQAREERLAELEPRRKGTPR